MYSISISVAYSVLERAGVESWSKCDKDFERDIYFRIGGNEYRIEWYINIFTIYLPCGASFKFENVRFFTTHPEAPHRHISFSRDGAELLVPVPEGVER